MPRTLSLLVAATLSAVAVLPVVTTTVALAQDNDAKTRALDFYQKGTIQYNLGEWDKATKYFKSAFEAFPDAAFLFNIAQTYRQSGNCRQSLFFYKRYLSLNENAPNRDEVEEFISSLESTCTGPGPAGTSPAPIDEPVVEPVVEPVPAPIATSAADAPPVDATADATQVAAVTTDATVTSELPSIEDDATESSLFIAHGSLGSSVLFAAGDLETGPQFNLTLGAGYPLALGSITVDVGALVSHTRMNWDGEDVSGTTGLTALLANVGASTELLSKVSVRAELGLGLMVLSGLDVPGNVFLDDGMSAGGLVSAASLRVALGAEYAITDKIAVSAHPLVLSVSPAPSGMREGIDSINTYQALLGVGYRM